MIMKIKNLSKSYGEVIALRDVSFEVKSGEIVALIGPNGAGKTTAIQSILGFLKPDRGEVFYRDIVVKSPKDIAKSISYIPDQPVYYEELTFKEHLRFTAMVNCIEKSEFNIRYEKLVSTFDIKDHLDKIPDTLSKGNKQKLMICCAFIRNFDVILADEPFTGLDPEQIKVLKDLFIQYKNMNKAIMLSTHLLDLAQTFCDRYILLYKGKVLLDVTNSFLKESYGDMSLEEIYIKVVNQGG